MATVASSQDGQYYLVHNVKDRQNAANKLADIKTRLMDLTDDGGILRSKLQHTQFEENPSMHPGSSSTSYSINKGEKIVMCLRDPRTQKIHDDNTLMYVAIHEAAHVACPEVGHTKTFQKHFTRLLKEAIRRGIYTDINYNKTPAPYCGIRIYERIL